jgi:hypothetical protein
VFLFASSLATTWLCGTFECRYLRLVDSHSVDKLYLTIWTCYCWKFGRKRYQNTLWNVQFHSRIQFLMSSTQNITLTERWHNIRTVTCLCVTLDGVLDWTLDLLTTSLGNTLNYSATANLHTLQITTAHAKCFPACYVFTIRSLVTAPNDEDSSAFALKSSVDGLSLPPLFQLSLN